MRLDLSVVRITDGKGHKKDKHALLSPEGDATLMTGDKIFIDLNLFDDDGEDAEDAIPEDIHYELLYNGFADVVFDGSLNVEKKGKHWLVGGGKQGIGKLAKSAGNAVVVRLIGGAPGGQNIAKIRARIGDLTDEITFYRAD